MRIFILLTVCLGHWLNAQTVGPKQYFFVDSVSHSDRLIDSVQSYYQKNRGEFKYLKVEFGSSALIVDEKEVIYKPVEALTNQQLLVLLKSDLLDPHGVKLEDELAAELGNTTKLSVRMLDLSPRDINRVNDNVLGTLQLKSKNLKTYRYKRSRVPKNSSGKLTAFMKLHREGSGSVVIRKVVVGFKQGFLYRLRVETTEGSFMLRDGDPVSLLEFQNFINTPVYDKQEDEFILLGDLLEIAFKPNLSYGPDDTTYVIDDFTKHEIKQVYGLNNLLELDVSTDLLGVFDNQDNGLIIFDIGMNFPLNLSVGRDHKQQPWAVRYFSDVSIFFRYARLDQNESELSLSDKMIDSPLNTLQRSDLAFRGDLNLIKLAPTSDRLDASLNFFSELNSVELKDDSEEESSLIRYNTVAMGVGLRPTIWTNPQFGVQFHFDIFRIWPYDDFEIKNMPEQLDCVRWGCKIEYFTKKDLSSSLFGKFNMVDNINANQGEFYQMSIGYRLPILSNQTISNRLKRKSFEVP